jgi:putative transposase
MCAAVSGYVRLIIGSLQKSLQCIRPDYCSIGRNCGDVDTASGGQKARLHRLRGRVRIHAYSDLATNLGTARLYPYSQTLEAPRTQLGDRGNHDKPERRHFSFYFQLSADNANFRGESVVQFIELVRHKVRGPITLVWDQIPIHLAKPVTDYFARHRRLVVELFPPYAPELNPVDNVWSYIKYNRSANYPPRNLHELRERIKAEFRRLQKRTDLLRSFFKHTGLSLDPIYPEVCEMR